MDLEAHSSLWDRTNHAYRLWRLPGGGGDELDRCLIVDLWDGTAVLIEDNALFRALKERMRTEGVPVMQRDASVPCSVPPLQAIAEDFLAGRITREECNQRRRALADDAEARRAWIRENGLDR